MAKTHEENLHRTAAVDKIRESGRIARHRLRTPAKTTACMPRARPNGGSRIALGQIAATLLSRVCMGKPAADLSLFNFER
jgi:hypothetical protein